MGHFWHNSFPAESLDIVRPKVCFRALAWSFQFPISQKLGMIWFRCGSVQKINEHIEHDEHDQDSFCLGCF